VSELEARLASLGVTIPHRSAAPAGAYVPAVASGNLVFTAGQLPFVDGNLTVVGKVGAEVTPEDARDCARISAINALAAVAEVLGSLQRVTRVVKVVGFVASDPGFVAQPGVIDGASELLADIFGDAGVHARSAVGVAALPLNSPVEVELVVEFA
jgi:enamine deaminase RidA (YjgF/YER057c/UK114 family)